METFSALLALCAGYSAVTGEFPSQRPVTRSFDVFCDLRLNKRWSKQSIRRWFETPLRSLWRHCNCYWPIRRFTDITLYEPISCLLRTSSHCHVIVPFWHVNDWPKRVNLHDLFKKYTRDKHVWGTMSAQEGIVDLNSRLIFKCTHFRANM